MTTTHKFLALTDRHSDKRGTVTYSVHCSCGKRLGPFKTKDAALAAFDAHKG